MRRGNFKPVGALGPSYSAYLYSHYNFAPYLDEYGGDQWLKSIPAEIQFARAKLGMPILEHST
jgi:hypothetical protein